MEILGNVLSAHKEPAPVGRIVCQRLLCRVRKGSGGRPTGVDDHEAPLVEGRRGD